MKDTLKTYGGLVIVLALVVGSIAWLERPQQLGNCVATGDQLYDLVFTDSEGECHGLADFAAPVTVLNVWASWCPFCVTELPDFALISEEFSEVPIVAINRGETIEQGMSFLETLEARGTVTFLFDPADSFYAHIGGFAMPETLFVDAEGNTLLHKRGIMSLEEMRENLDVLLHRMQPNVSGNDARWCLARGGNDACGVGL